MEQGHSISQVLRSFVGHTPDVTPLEGLYFKSSHAVDINSASARAGLQLLPLHPYTHIHKLTTVVSVRRTCY